MRLLGVCVFAAAAAAAAVADRGAAAATVVSAWRACLPPPLTARVRHYCNRDPVAAGGGDEGGVGVPGARLVSLTVLVRHGDRSAIHALPGSARVDWPCSAPGADDAAWMRAAVEPVWSTHDALHGVDVGGAPPPQPGAGGGGAPHPPPPTVAAALAQWALVRGDAQNCSRAHGGELSTIGWHQLRTIGAHLGRVRAYRALLRRDEPRTAALSVGTTDTGRTALSATALLAGLLEAAVGEGVGAGGVDEPGGETGDGGEPGDRDVDVDRRAADLAAAMMSPAGELLLHEQELASGGDSGGREGPGDDSEGPAAAAAASRTRWRRMAPHGGGGGRRAAAGAAAHPPRPRNLHAHGHGVRARLARGAIPQLGRLPLRLHVLDRARDPAMWGASPAAASCPGLQPRFDAELSGASSAHALLPAPIAARLEAAGMVDPPGAPSGARPHRVGMADPPGAAAAAAVVVEGRGGDGGGSGHGRGLESGGGGGGGGGGRGGGGDDEQQQQQQQPQQPPHQLLHPGDSRVALSRAAAPRRVAVAGEPPGSAPDDPARRDSYYGPLYELPAARVTAENAADDVLTRLCHGRGLPCFGGEGTALDLEAALPQYGCAPAPSGADAAGRARQQQQQEPQQQRCMRVDDAFELVEAGQRHYRARFAGPASRALLYPLLDALAQRWDAMEELDALGLSGDGGRGGVAGSTRQPHPAADAGDDDAADAPPRRPARVLLRALHDTVIAPLSAALGLHDEPAASAAGGEATAATTAAAAAAVLGSTGGGEGGGSPFLHADAPEWWPRYAARIVLEQWRLPAGDAAPSTVTYVRVLRDGKDVTRWAGCAVELPPPGGAGGGSGGVVLCPVAAWKALAARLLERAAAPRPGGDDGAPVSWGALCAGK